MKDVLLFAILGIGAGASYALIALGIVLIQKGSGAVNFAQGAIAGCSAIFFASATNGGMGKFTALLIALAGGRRARHRLLRRWSCARCARRRCWRASWRRSA